MSPASHRLAFLGGVGIGCYCWYLLRRAQRAEAKNAALVARRNALALELMGTRNKFMHSDDSLTVGRAFVPLPTDVFIVTYPKCGTTWMTQILNLLRCGGEMPRFGEITELVPWDILAHDCGQTLSDRQIASPRLFKSHESWEHVAKGARYVYVARNPLDAFHSFHKFMPAYMGLEATDVDEEAFARAIFAGASISGQIWHHFVGWWERRHEPDVLWVFFEDLCDDLRGTVERVARFVGIEPSEELMRKVVAQSSFDFMSSAEHAHHFDDHFVRSKVGPAMGLLDLDAPRHVSKVRRGGGRVGSRRALPAAVARRLDEKWAAVVAGPTGCASYDELRAAVSAGR